MSCVCLRRIVRGALFVGCALALPAFVEEPPAGIEEIIVTGEFRSDPIDSLPSSVSVATSEQIQGLEAQHLEQVLNTMPNVNFASGASRGRYFQIRGVGETEQFIAPLN